MKHSRRKTDALDALNPDAPVDIHIAARVINPWRAIPPATTLRLTSAQIFDGALEVHIDHHGTLYRLKQTALGKLILTK